MMIDKDLKISNDKANDYNEQDTLFGNVATN